MIFWTKFAQEEYFQSEIEKSHVLASMVVTKLFRMRVTDTTVFLMSLLLLVAETNYRGIYFLPFFFKSSLSHSLCPACVTSNFQFFPPFATNLTSFTQIFHCLKSSLMVANQHLFGQPQLLFSSTFKSKICQVYSSLQFTCPNQRSLLHLNTEFRLSSFNPPTHILELC